jgi:hypothetical protein
MPPVALKNQASRLDSPKGAVLRTRARQLKERVTGRLPRRGRPPAFLPSPSSCDTISNSKFKRRKNRKEAWKICRGSKLKTSPYFETSIEGLFCMIDVSINHPDYYKNTKISYMREMAYPLEVIKIKLLQYDDARLEHLLKLYYFRSFKQYLYTWISTVYKCTIRTYKDSKTNNLPTKDEIYTTLWKNAKDIYKEHHDCYVKNFNYYNDLSQINHPDVEGSMVFCEEYFKWLSEKLSEKGSVDIEEVEEELVLLLQFN